MLRIERYLFRTASTAFLAGLLTLTAVIWVTQALKQLDLMTSKGQTILVFLTMTGLGLPFLTAVIAPVALFASVLYCLNKLNGDSELVVMSASGISTARLLAAFPRAVRARVPGGGGALPRDHAPKFPGHADPHRAGSRRLHRQFRAAGRLHRTRSRLRLSLPRTGARRLAARRIHSGPPRPRRRYRHISPRSARSSRRKATPTSCC